MFISPYVEFSLHDDARVAWLIPIQGAFPWDVCTPGTLLDSTEPPPMKPNLVQWNPASLIKFWHFLLALRNSGSLGALGVSLQLNHPSTRMSSNTPAMSGDHTSSTSSSSHEPLAVEPRKDLIGADYFKLYHDASRSFYVRKAIDCWSFQSECDVSKIRILKGAKIPLVDEVSTAILAC